MPSVPSKSNVFWKKLLSWIQYSPQRLPWILDWILAAAVVAVFSLFYLLDYLRLEWGRNRYLPSITTLPRTKEEMTIQEDLVQRFKKDDSMRDVFRPFLDANHQILPDEIALQQLQSNFALRQQADRILRVLQRKDTMILSYPAVVQQWQRLWPKVVQGPATSDVSNQQPIIISLIVPVYQEGVENVLSTLRDAQEQCSKPATIQVVVVEYVPSSTRGPSRLQEALQDMYSGWAEICHVIQPHNQGRGPLINRGIQKGATGKIVTVVHADTRLPPDWDAMIQTALLSQQTAIWACAFLHGISRHPPPLPAGIRLVDSVLGYLRCRWCRLPYGDSVLSIRSDVLEYLGGYPNQPLMEDYELVHLIRQQQQQQSINRLTILPAQAWCSPRRWQRYGVAYTLVVNALCVSKYQRHHATAEELYDFYYHLQTNTVASKKME